jgi:hypothetical protein
MQVANCPEVVLRELERRRLSQKKQSPSERTACARDALGLQPAQNMNGRADTCGFLAVLGEAFSLRQQALNLAAFELYSVAHQVRARSHRSVPIALPHPREFLSSVINR